MNTVSDQKAKAMRLFAILGCIFAVCDIVFTGLITKHFPLSSILQNAVLIVCLLFLVSAYNKHDKNLMNMMAGAVMTELLLLQIQYTDFSLAEAEGLYLLSCVASLVLLITLFLAFIFHLYTTFRHNDSGSAVKFGVVLFRIALFIAAAEIVISVFLSSPFSIVRFMNWSSWYLMEVAVLGALIFLRLRLNELKTAKEAQL